MMFRLGEDGLIKRLGRLLVPLCRIGLNGKIVFAVLSSVLLAVAVLTVLIIRRETALLEMDGKKNAEVLATTISTALRDNMLAGLPDETVRLTRELAAIPGVMELNILAADGRRAFGMPGDPPDLDEETKWRIRNGLESAFLARDAFYIVKPIRNEPRCRSCHPESAAIRGAVVVKLSTAEITGNVADLIRRMAGFAAATAIGLSALLIFLGRRLIVIPIRGLRSAAQRIARGEYVLFGSRGVRCHEILGCTKAECPSYGNNEVPCWLTTGTFCIGDSEHDHVAKTGDCRKCRVYQELRGDEIRQLLDDFNRMSLMLKKNEEDLTRRMSEVNKLNLELRISNTKLTTLLDASRLITSTLDLEDILSASMKIILDATSLKAGIILLLENETDKRCYEFFGCKAFNCPAYKSTVNCWQLAGTMCHGGPLTCPHGATAAECWRTRNIHTHLHPAHDYEEKIEACSGCEFFANIVLIPKIAAGFRNGSQLEEKIRLDGSTVHRALVMGQAIVDYSRKNPFGLSLETATEIAIPLKKREQIIGVLYLASDEKLSYDEQHIAFFRLLSEVISSGIFNSWLYDEVERSYLQTIEALMNAIEAKDLYTKGHSERVAALSIKIAEALGLSPQEKEHLRFAALLHDVGKIGIDSDLLRKHVALNGCEKDGMQSHPEKGAQILAPVHFLKPVLSAIRHHHERYDGTGYPLGLSGGEIPLKARILSVADAWDAMRSDRPYRNAFSIEEAKKELIRHAGTQFDPDVVEVFIRDCLKDFV